MAKILADKDIKKLIGSAIIDSDEGMLNPNGIELRLGKEVLFHSTGEEKEMSEETFLKVNPGETVSISSIESVDFRNSTVQKTFPEHLLMGFVTPTTTMMREGISQVTTKIDAGFHGMLNWGLRNGSTKDLILQFGEPIFKLTIFALEKEESPAVPYGEKEDDSYQDSKGITRSKRKIPADIPKVKIVCSSLEQLDAKKQLTEAGYPFDHIGTELTKLSNKLDSLSKEFRQVFDRKFLRIVGVILSGIITMYGGVSFLEKTTLGGNAVAFIAVVMGFILFVVTYFLSRK